MRATYSAQARPKSRHKIVFDRDTDIEAVVLAQLGYSTHLIKERTGLSDSQIVYRLGKAKRAEGLPVGEGFRTQWRAGTSTMARTILATYAPRMRREVRKTLPSKFVTPFPESRERNGKKALAHVKARV